MPTSNTEVFLFIRQAHEENRRDIDKIYQKLDKMQTTLSQHGAKCSLRGSNCQRRFDDLHSFSVVHKEWHKKELSAAEEKRKKTVRKIKQIAVIISGIIAAASGLGLTIF